jgi:aminopeptidase N
MRPRHGIARPGSAKRSILVIAVAIVITPFAVRAGSAEVHNDAVAPASSSMPRTELAAVAPRGRLPSGVRPMAYQVDLIIDPRRDDFSGEVAIDVELAAPTDRIWMHGEGLEVSSVTGSTKSGRNLEASYAEVLPSGVAAITFAEKLPAGRVTLRFRYRTDFDRSLAGLFKVEERGESYVLAKSESIQARSFLPSFDEPGLKAPFDIRLTIPGDYEAIGNTPVVYEQALEGGFKRLVFATTPPMSTYLLSLAVGPFDVVEREPIAPNEFRARPVPLRGVARKGRAADLRYVLDVTPRMVEIFERELRRPYPFEKLDIVAAPQWPSGATELSAAITYREQLILVGDNPAPGARRSLLGVHAHEIAHMWFGNQVTPPWWDDLWLKEGFATWATPVALTRLEPDGGHELDAVERSLSAMRLDSLDSTRAVREPIADNDEIRNAYDAITYSKSLGVIHMVDRYFGPDTFRPALGRYVAAFADGVASSSDFYRVIGEETKSPALTRTFRGFVEQRGVPLIEAALRCEGRGPPSLKLRQSRYKALGSAIEETGERWTIPLCVRSPAGRQCYTLTQKSQTVDLADATCPEWVLPNAGGSGYYRWTLETPVWAELVEDFESLSPAEALSAIDSAFASFEAGRFDASVLLELVAASAGNGTRQVVTAPLPYLRKYVNQYLSVTDRARFLQFARDLYQPILERTVGSRDDDDRLLYAELIGFMALTARDPQARAQLLQMAQAFTGFERARDAAALSSDLYYPALVVAIQDSDAGFVQELVRFRGRIDDPLFDNASAQAIGRITDAELLEFVHELALNEKFGPRETFALIIEALSEPSLRQRHWSWLRANFPAVVDRLPAQSRRFAPRMAAEFCDPDELDELRHLFATQGALIAGHQRNLDQTVEQIELCIAQRSLGGQLADALRAMQTTAPVQGARSQSPL